ncbi:MAG TPA: NAD(P)/FAD-dependent oxidoreductase [Verrucomicrobiales bacterium]|nr:NAD(P)/FAD-dependent oxidoreductase [Verrucomicrobiales bacterium]
MSPGLTAIIGAGPAGLTAAYLLCQQGRPVVVLESHPDLVGGICRTVCHKGFRFDIGGHRFFSKSREIEDFWSQLLSPEDFPSRRRMSRILYRGRFFSYPLRALEALRNLGLLESLLCVASYVRARLFPIRDPQNFEQWVANHFGRRLFRVFFKTYTEKVWGTSCGEISADWAAQRIKGFHLGRAIVSAVFPWAGRRRGADPVKTLIHAFRYPRLGPGMLWERCAERVREMGGEVRLGARVCECRFQEESRTWAVTVSHAAGTRETITAAAVISSAPLRELVNMLRPALPEYVHAAARRLSYRDFILVAVMVKDRGGFADHWIYVHDPAVQVGRIQNFKAWSPEMTPDSGLACYGMEYFCFAGKDGLWGMADGDLKGLARRELVQLGLARTEDIVDACVVRQGKAYPVYDAGYAENVAVIRKALEERFPSLHLAGRNGMHKYNNQDHSMMTAMLCVENILAGQRIRDPWMVNEDAQYHEGGPGSGGASGLRSVPETAA